ncbi:MAG: PLDc_N domain-containing protein [Planctomycetaceae bacterium]|nr:PLDc_N domain-containing protein [Planctomycetaceae bacterium]
MEIVALLFFILIFALSFVIPIAMIALMIWMVIDCATNEPSEGTDKLVWILVILFVPLVGPLIYYFVRRPERIRTEGK